jgi:hypothetical protein
VLFLVLDYLSFYFMIKLMSFHVQKRRHWSTRTQSYHHEIRNVVACAEQTALVTHSSVCLPSEMAGRILKFSATYSTCVLLPHKMSHKTLPDHSPTSPSSICRTLTGQLPSIMYSTIDCNIKVNAPLHPQVSGKQALLNNRQ